MGQSARQAPPAGRLVYPLKAGESVMMQSAFATLCQGRESDRPHTIEELLAGVRLLLPMLDVIPNAAIFIKDVQARYVLANRTLVQRCGLKDLQPLLGKTSAEVFPAQLGPGYTEQDRRVLEQGVVLAAKWICSACPLQLSAMSCQLLVLSLVSLYKLLHTSVLIPQCDLMKLLYKSFDYIEVCIYYIFWLKIHIGSLIHWAQAHFDYLE